ncbi:hypothetical protein FGB62_342g03 [Gracilaria domingensis]|nr:hypothetical protein FGB62_342g03 [Gracilaria domingensis]
MNPKYFCLPQYNCPCYPRGKAVSRMTVLKQRRDANKIRLQQGLQEPLPCGPREGNSVFVRAQYPSYIEQSLSNHDVNYHDADEIMNRGEQNEGVTTAAHHCVNPADVSNEMQHVEINFMNAEPAFLQTERQYGALLNLSSRNDAEHISDVPEPYNQIS